MRISRHIHLAWLAGGLVTVLLAGRAAAEEAGPLAAYVAKADESYGWTVRREGELAGSRYVELTLTSQTWHTIPWKHQLFILKPAKVRNGARALLLIAGGRWRDELATPPGKDEKLPGEALHVAVLAAQMGTPVAVLLQVPEQPLFNGLVEDQLIAYTFAQYLLTQDSTWPLLLPMTKSAVKAMDAVQAWTKDNWSLEIAHFTVTGASKRGWTTWLTAAVDPRVDALAPMVIDMLNMGPQMELQVRSWGGYSEQIHDYTDRGIQKFMATERGQALRQIVDPYSYRQKITQPKLIVLGTNDRYWPLDALGLYWNDLVGEKYVLYVPNAGHSLKDPDHRVPGTISAFHRQAAGELKLAQLTWKIDQTDGKLALSLTSDVKPERVVTWVATSPTRDFRDAHWDSQRPEADGEQGYRYTLEAPQTGFAAAIGEAKYATDTLPYYLSTNVTIVGSAKPSKP